MSNASRFAFFVDGSNLMGSLKRLGVQVDDYGKFFQHLLNKSVDVWNASFVSPGDASARLVRVNWYEVGDMDDWKLEDPRVEQSLPTRSKRATVFITAKSCCGFRYADLRNGLSARRASKKRPDTSSLDSPISEINLQFGV